MKQAPATPLQPKQVRETIACIPIATGLRMDHIQPMLLRKAPDTHIVRITQLFNRAEQRGAWAATFYLTQVAFLDKSAGGDRPIPLLQTLYRTWSRRRAETVNEWDRQHKHNSDVTTEGYGALRTIHKDELESELLPHEGATRLRKMGVPFPADGHGSGDVLGMSLRGRIWNYLSGHSSLQQHAPRMCLRDLHGEIVPPSPDLGSRESLQPSSPSSVC